MSCVDARVDDPKCQFFGDKMESMPPTSAAMCARSLSDMVDRARRLMTQT